MNMHRMRDECLLALLVFASVIVSDAGGLYISKEVATIYRNESFVVVCRDESGSPVTWRGPKEVLGPKTRPKVQMMKSGTTLIFSAAVNEDAGTYTCSNENGEHKEFNLTIAEPLIFMDTSATQIGIEGRPFTLRCEVQGGKVTWLVEGGDITDKGRFQVGGDGLMIKKLNRTDSKTYICKAFQQSTGAVEDRRINLRVLHEPVFTHPRYAQQEVVWGYINGTVNLTCVVIADPPAEFKWMKVNDKKRKIGKIINESADVSILQLHIVDNSTFGDYKCIAKNEYGTIDKRYTLELGVQPSPPEVVLHKRIHSNYVDLEVHGLNTTDVRVGMEPVGVNVQYREKDTTEWKEREFNITKDNFYHLDNLTHSTEYEIRVATRNAAGLSGHSEILSVKTLTPQPNGAPSTFPLYRTVLTMSVLYEMYNLAFW